MLENISQHYGPPLTAFNKTALEIFQEMARTYVNSSIQRQKPSSGSKKLRLRKEIQKKVEY